LVGLLNALALRNVFVLLFVGVCAIVFEMASLAALFQRLLTIAIGDEPSNTQLQPPSTCNKAAEAGAAGVSSDSGVERTSNENDTLVISAEEIKVEVATAMVADDGAGAISVFVGTTRDNFQGELLALDVAVCIIPSWTATNCTRRVMWSQFPVKCP
jgi:hypothetical protein